MSENKEKKMKRDEKKEILQSIQNQIAGFDNKASIFLAAIGIVFALSTSFFDVFHSDWYISLVDETFKWWYKFIFITYVCISSITILCFIFVLVPRKKTINKIFGNYYCDIAHTNREKIDELLNDYSKDDVQLTDQIKINSDICNKKHLFLISGVFMMLPFMIVLSTLFFMIINK